MLVYYIATCIYFIPSYSNAPRHIAIQLLGRLYTRDYDNIYSTQTEVVLLTVDIYKKLAVLRTD